MARDLLDQMDRGARLILDQDPRRRVEGIRQVAASARQLPLPERVRAIPVLEGIVEDKEAFVRWNLAFALGEIAHPDGLPVLERLSEDEHANVRFRVALAVMLIGDDRGIPILERLATDTYKIGEHLAVREFAALALGRFQREQAVSTLARLADNEDATVRWHAAVALGDVGQDSGVAALAKLVGDPNPFVRAHTAIALAQIGHRDGLPLLERLTQDSMPRVAQISRASLALLQNLVAAKGE